MRNKMKIYKKNIKYFKDKKPNIYNFIKDCSISDITYSQTDKEFVIKTANSLYIEEKDIKKILFSNLEFAFYFPQYKENKNLKNYLHSRLIESMDIDLNPERIKSDFSKTILKHRYFPVVFINGLGTGRILNDLTDEIKTDLIIVYEPDPYKFVVSLFNIDYRNMFENYKMYLIIGNNEDIIRRSIKNVLTSNNPVLVPFIAKIKLYENNPYCENFDFNLKKAIYLSIKGWGFYDDEKIALKHGIENLKDKSSYLYRPSKKIKNSTAFIIASGPSLEKDIDFIRKNSSRAVIFSCGTAIHKLYKEGIIPDFHIELERETIRKEILEKLPSEYLKNIDLIAADVIHPDIKKMFRNSYLFFREGSIHTQLLKPSLIPPAISPTVTNSATSISIISGFENIIFFGTDMGFKEKNKKHVSGTIFDSKEFKYIEEFMDNYLETEGNFGGTVFTNDILLWSKEHLEILISHFNDRKFFNCSDGARIKNAIPVKNPAEINIPEIEKDKILENIKSLFSEDYNRIINPDISDYYTISINMLDDFIRYIEKSDIKNFKNLIYFIKESYELILDYQRYNIPYVLLSGSMKTVLMYMYKIGITYSENNDRIIEDLKSRVLEGLLKIREDLKLIKPYLNGEILEKLLKNK